MLRRRVAEPFAEVKLDLDVRRTATADVIDRKLATIGAFARTPPHQPAPGIDIELPIVSVARAMRDAFNMDVAAVRLRASGGRHEARKIRYVRYESEGSFRRNRDIDRAAIIGHGVILLIITQNASAAMAMQDCMLDMPGIGT
jgi:hypothetical protein